MNGCSGRLRMRLIQAHGRSTDAHCSTPRITISQGAIECATIVNF